MPPTATQREEISPKVAPRADAHSPHVETPHAESPRLPEDRDPQPLAKSPLRSLTGVQILATGGYVPERSVSNEHLGHGYDPAWILQRTGIVERRRAAPDEATSDLAYEAAVRCIEQAGVDPDEIDLLIVATMTPDSPMPSAACQLHRRLGLTGVPAMDVNAACAGFMYALITGAQFVKSGCSRYALVVGADVMSQIVDPQDQKTYPLFGDGAGAVLLGAGSAEQGLRAYTLGADGSGADLLYIAAGGSREPLTPEALLAKRHKVCMDGRAVFKWAVRLLYDAVMDVLGHAQCSPADVDLVVLHQANIRIIEAAVDNLGIDRRKVVVNLDRYGNTSAGSIPLALAEAHAQGRLRSGDRVLLCGFGAGLAWGAALMQW